MADADLRALLTGERAAAAEHVAALQRDFDGMVDASESSNADDEHDPEGATIAFERAQVAALLEQARTRLVDVERALHLLDTGGYSRCSRCGGAIAPERLAARPAAQTCIDCARLGRR